MTTKIQTALEQQTTNIAEAIINLFKEIDSFAERNRIDNKDCCHRCLKAHAIKISKKLGIYEHSKSIIKSITNEEPGHIGYYLDGEVLIKL